MMIKLFKQRAQKNPTACRIFPEFRINQTKKNKISFIISNLSFVKFSRFQEKLALQEV